MELVLDDPKNELFIKIERTITKLGRKIAFKIAERTAMVIPKDDEFVVQPLDRYDYYEQKSKALKRFSRFEVEADELQEENLEKQVFKCLFRFMQLLCECNNIDFKNFIREQVDR